MIPIRMADNNVMEPIMIMRFRPAKISLINRRLYLPRLPLTPVLDKKQNNPAYVQLLIGSHHINFRMEISLFAR